MYGKIMIGTKETAMLANAASPYLFKQVFHEDFLLVSRRMVDEQAGRIEHDQDRDG